MAKIIVIYSIVILATNYLPALNVLKKLTLSPEFSIDNSIILNLIPKSYLKIMTAFIRGIDLVKV